MKCYAILKKIFISSCILCLFICAVVGTSLLAKDMYETNASWKATIPDISMVYIQVFLGWLTVFIAGLNWQPADSW